MGLGKKSCLYQGNSQFPMGTLGSDLDCSLGIGISRRTYIEL